MPGSSLLPNPALVGIQILILVFCETPGAPPVTSFGPDVCPFGKPRFRD